MKKNKILIEILEELPQSTLKKIKKLVNTKILEVTKSKILNDNEKLFYLSVLNWFKDVLSYLVKG